MICLGSRNGTKRKKATKKSAAPGSRKRKASPAPAADCARMRIARAGEAQFPTRFGDFRIHAFTDGRGGEHLALAMNVDSGSGPVPLRIHSRCLTGDTFASLRCDCRAQLESALDYIRNEGAGILIYLDQEGRGIGLANKIKAYALQDSGMDTVEANEHLGFDADSREYSAAAEILGLLGVGEVELLTNNPEKVEGLGKHGITVSRRVPLLAAPNEHNARYLETKREKLSHILE